MPQTSAALTKLLNLEVIVGNPFANIDVPETATKTLLGYAPFYAVAVGLALRS